jgi:hypothetical protein
MRFEWVVFYVAFGFSLVVNALSNSYFLFTYALNVTPGNAFVAFQFARAVSFLVSPLALFASFYIIGRSIDFGARFQPVLVSLFLGNWIGHLIAHFSFMLWFSSLSGVSYLLQPYLLPEIVWAVITYALSLEFFVGLSAISIAYIVKRRETNHIQTTTR